MCFCVCGVKANEKNNPPIFNATFYSSVETKINDRTDSKFVCPSHKMRRRTRLRELPARDHKCMPIYCKGKHAIFEGCYLCVFYADKYQENEFTEVECDACLQTRLNKEKTFKWIMGGVILITVVCIINII